MIVMVMLMISPPSPLFRFKCMNSSFGTMNLGTKESLKEQHIRVEYVISSSTL